MSRRQGRRVRRGTKAAREAAAIEAVDLGTPQTRKRSVIRDVRGVGRRAQIVHPLDRLLHRGTIDAGMHDAGMRFLGDYEVGVAGARERPENPGHIDSGRIDYGIPDYVLHRSEAVTAACHAMGIETSKVVINVVVARLTPEALGNGPRERREIMGVLKAGLRSLVRHYEHGPRPRRDQ